MNESFSQIAAGPFSSRHVGVSIMGLKVQSAARFASTNAPPNFGDFAHRYFVNTLSVAF